MPLALMGSPKESVDREEVQVPRLRYSTFQDWVMEWDWERNSQGHRRKPGEEKVTMVSMLLTLEKCGDF